MDPATLLMSGITAVTGALLWLTRNYYQKATENEKTLQLVRDRLEKEQEKTARLSMELAVSQNCIMMCGHADCHARIQVEGVLPK